MNQLYPLVQQTINKFSVNSVGTLLTKLNQDAGAYSEQFECGENVIYVLKRLTAALMSKDHTVKFHCNKTLKLITERVPAIRTVSQKAFAELFLSVSDYKVCRGNKSQINGYIRGKLDVIVTLDFLFIDSQSVIDHLIKLVPDFESFQDSLIEALYLICKSPASLIKFNDKLKETIGTAKLSAGLLWKLLTGKGKGKKEQATEKDIKQLIETAIESDYPKESIPLKYVGFNLTIIPNVASFFKTQYLPYLQNNEDKEQSNSNIKNLFYILQIQKYFLQKVQIQENNLQASLNIEMLKVWLEQLRVKNKHMRDLATSIKVNFGTGASPKLSFKMLTWLHKQNVYLENISSNHPLAQLYKNVQSVSYWSYLVKLIQTDEEPAMQAEKDQQQKHSKRQEYLSEVQYLTRQRSKQLGVEKCGQTLTILIKEFQKNPKSEKLLNLVWSFCHHAFDEQAQNKTNKKKFYLHSSALTLLNKVQISQLEFDQQVLTALTNAIKFVTLKVKKNKQSSNKTIIGFLNFCIALLYYCIVYPEESDICAQLEFVAKDLQKLLVNEQSSLEGAPKKKRKQNQEEAEQDKKKPIHILVEVFISLLTKAPTFLRNFINLAFERLVPYLQEVDMDTLLDVIQKPDQEYIEQV